MVNFSYTEILLMFYLGKDYIGVFSEGKIGIVNIVVRKKETVLFSSEKNITKVACYKEISS